MEPINLEKFWKLQGRETLGCSFEEGGETMIGNVFINGRPYPEEEILVKIEAIFHQSHNSACFRVGEMLFVKRTALFTSTTACHQCKGAKKVWPGREGEGFSDPCPHCDSIGLEPV